MKKGNIFIRVLAYTLVLSVIFSQMVFSPVATATTVDNTDIAVWDGTKAESFAGGDGTAASPFLIENAQQLYKMVEEYHTYEASYGKYFEITNDIYLNDVADGTSIVDLWGKKNWLAGYGDTIATVSKANSFNGTLDGNGNTIYGLYVTGVKNAGLFPAIASYAVVKNLNFDNILLTGGSGYGGAIAGQAIYYAWQSAAQITNCSVTNATVGQWGNMEFAGGLFGNINECSVTLTNCYSSNVTLSNWESKGVPGGLIGNAGSGGTLKINNSYTVGNFPTNSKVSKAVCTNVYTDVAIPEGNTTAGVTVLTADQMKGEAAKTNMAGFDFTYVWNTVENSYPVLRDEILPVWDGESKDYNLEGTGSETDPYLIKTAEQLLAVVSGNNNGAFTGKSFKLANDIRINDTASANWKESAKDWKWADFRFIGTFDGDGHTIDGLCNKNSHRVMGLFFYVGADNDGKYTTTIKNFKMTNAYFGSTAADGVAFVAGQASRVAYFDGIYIDETCEIESTVKGAGGILGQSGYNVFMSNIAMNGKVVGGSNVGAFVGTLSSGASLDIKSSYTSADLYVQGVTDRNLSTTSKDVYVVKKQGTIDKTTTLLTADQMKGEAAKTNMSPLDFNFVWQTVENDYPVLRENPFYDWWDGTKAENFAGGDGTAANPFLIENAAQLYKMVAEYYTHEASLGKYFEITKDIYISNPGTNYTFTGAKNWLAAYGDTIATVSKANSFSGTLNGNGNKIYGLYISGKKSAGLFPGITSYSDIKNLAFDNVYITGGSGNAGAIAGSAYWYDNNKTATITNCSVVNSTIGKGGNIGYVGGLVGHMLDCTITFTDCYSNSLNLSDWGTPGGIVGSAYESGKLFMVNCYSAGHYPVRANVNKAVCTNVYTDTARPENNTTENITVLESAQMTGAAARDNMLGFNFNQIWQYGNDGEYPVHKTNDAKALYWDGTAAEALAGKGSAEEPYEISNAKELYFLANESTANTYGKYYKLTNDIVISGTHEGWEKENPYSWVKKTAYLDGYGYLNSFAGTLDGAGHTVSGLFYADEGASDVNYAYGLLPSVSANAVIKNINVENVASTVTNDTYVGAVAGVAHVTTDDIVNPLNMVQFVGVNVTDSDVAVLGGASRGVKFELCNADEFIGSDSEKVSVRNCNTDNAKYDDSVLIFNTLNADATMLVNLRNTILCKASAYMTDINGDSSLNLKDLVSAKKALAMVSNAGEEVLVWSQDFDGNALDSTVWTQSSSMSKGTTLEYADNSTVADGKLTLSCADTEKTDENGDKIYSVNQGLSTIDTMSFKYGRLEMRAKVPFGAGAFPSLWLTSRGAIGYDENSPYSTEIDIFEVFGKKASNDHLVTCIHKWYNEDGVKTGDECSCGTGILAGNWYNISESDRSYQLKGDAQNEFHTFTFEWDENKMSFAVDGDVYYTAYRSAMSNFDLNGYKTDISGIFDSFLCIRLNNHMYTTGEGAAYVYKGAAGDIDASKLNYEIDYIKLYQKNDGKSEINVK